MDLKILKKKLNENPELIFKKLGIKYELFGDNIYCPCPIHESSDNPKALSFALGRGIWKCWTRDCQHHYQNDVFGLIMGTLSSQSGEEKTFSDVLKWCNDVLNIKTKYNNVKKTIEEDDDPFFDMIATISSVGKVVDLQAIDMKFNYESPSEYFYGRGFNKKTLKYFDVGDCYDKGTMYERSIIPIHNDDGSKLVGIVGRSIKEYRQPKFLFYPKGFDKRYCLYNYHRALEHIQKTNTLFIAEGQGDVWKLYEAGIQNAVSIFGKTITREQEQKISKLPITRLVVLTDNDQAGRESKIQIKRQFSRMYKLIFPQLSNKDIGEMKVNDIKKLLENLKGSY
jgi:5S rRNA maturation endonuclease (ribonuclease M5)